MTRSMYRISCASARNIRTLSGESCFQRAIRAVPRYPSLDWIKELVRLAEDYHYPLKLSAHLCGRWVRDFVIDGRFSWIQEKLGAPFQRVQLNFHGQWHRAHPYLADILAQSWGYRFILQCDGVNDAMALDPFALSTTSRLCRTIRRSSFCSVKEISKLR